MALTALPYGARGPGYVLDDWFLLANTRFDGWPHALQGELLRARPGSAVVYALTFGVVGRHPLVAYAVQVALVAAAAVLLRALLARYVDRRAAWAAAALWVIVPNHTSLLHWTTATALTAALVLLLWGLLLLDDGRVLPAALVLAASVSCYEATAPAALAGLVAIPLLRRRPLGRTLVVSGAVLVPVLVWMVASVPSVKRGLGQRADLTLMLPAHAGWGVLPSGPVATAGGLLFAVVLTLVVVEAARARRIGEDAALAFAGLAVIALGTAPFVFYFYAPLGAGDRVQVVAGVGTAMAWVGVLRWVSARMPKGAGAALAACVVAGMGVAAWQRSAAWAAAVDDGERVIASFGEVHAGDRVSVERPPIRRNVAVFLDGLNLLGAVQLEAGTREVSAELRPAG